MKKKLLLVAGLAAVMSMGLASCGGGDGGESKPSEASSTKQVVYVEDVTLNSAEVTVNINETFKLEATVTPSNVTTRGVSYKSENETIAKVSSSGVITGLAAGETKIIVTSKGAKADGKPVVKEVKVKVNEVFISELRLAKESVRLEVNGTEQVQASVLPENASNQELEYSSENAAVATVSTGGLIKGIGIGSTKIKVKTKGKNASGMSLEKSISVEVIATAIAELKIAQPTVMFNLEEGVADPTAKIEYEVLPSNATEKGVTFESSDPSVATVSDAGIITAKAVGEAIITLTTVGKDASGNSLTGTVTVTVTSQRNVVEFQNSDGTLLQGFTEEDIAVGEVPDYTGAIPGRASDEENIYIFRGFDKEILPYAKSDSKIVYTAVYEATKSTPRHVSMTKQDDGGTEKVIWTVTGESKGVDTETIKNRAWLAFQQYQGSWGTTYSDPQAPIINADGSWVMQMELKDEIYGGGGTYMGKYVWNSDTASKPVDLKILHRENRLRYRHTAAGEVLEDNQISDEWDGTFPDDYVENGNWGGGTSTNLDAEKRQAFKDAIAAPTWVGLGVTYEPAKIIIGEKVWELFTDESVWFLPSVRTSGKAAAKQIDIVAEDGGEVYYSVSGQLAFEGAVTEAELMKASMDFEHNGSIDGGSGFVGATGKAGPGINPARVDLAGENFVLRFRVDNLPGIKDMDLNGYYPHFSLKDIGETGERADFPSSIKRTNGQSVMAGGYTYTIKSVGGNAAGYWGNPGLEIEKYVTPISDVSEIGYTKEGNNVFFNLKGKAEGVSGQATVKVGGESATVNVAADGTFTAKVPTTSFNINTGNNYSDGSTYEITLEKDGVVHKFKDGGLNKNAKITQISVVTEAVPNGANYVLVNKGGLIKASTVSSAFTSSVGQLSKDGDKVMLHVVGVVENLYNKAGLKLAINNKNSDENFAIAVTAGEHGCLDFTVDVTDYVQDKGNNRLYLVNEDGRTIRNNDGRGINWFWMNDWSLGINEYGPVESAGKAYTLSNGNNMELRVANAEN